MKRDSRLRPAPEYKRKSRLAEGLVAKQRARLAEGRLEEAFRIGEWLLADGPLAETYDALLAPLERHGAQGGLIKDAAMYDLLEAMAARRKQAGLEPWYVLLEVDLLSHLCRVEEAFAAAGRMDSFPDRYGWMRHNRGMMLLRQRRAYDEARREFESVLRGAPVFWKAAACAAETELCQGRDAAAFAIMDGLVRGLKGVDRAAVLSWRGEMRLWRGLYDDAARDLTQAARLGSPLAGCWLGAARLQQGKVDEALALLDGHLGRSPEDVEALIWRGEVLHRLRAPSRAQTDLDTAVRIGRNPLWALVNRALVRLDLDDERGFWTDYRALDRMVRGYFEWRLKLCTDDKPTAQDARAVLEAILAAGRGVRQSEGYLFPIWMKWG